MKCLHGYTLIEILISIALISILLIISIPSWQHISNRYKTEMDVNRVLGTLQYARDCAINLQINVHICPSDNGYSCTQTNIPSWTHGWLVYLAPNSLSNTDAVIKNNTFDLNEVSALNSTISPLRVYPALNNGELSWHGLVNKNEIQFRADGSAVGYNGRFDYCTNNENVDRCKSIILSPTGRTRVSTHNSPLQ